MRNAGFVEFGADRRETRFTIKAFGVRLRVQDDPPKALRARCEA
jgi:hypothetical protein